MDKNEKAKNNVYRILRTNAYLSQEDVENTIRINRNTIGDIENNRLVPKPEDIVQLSKVYQSKRLCHWYCASQCPIGAEIALSDIDPIHPEDFGQTMMTIHSAIRHLKALDLDELIDIAKDGRIEPSELETYKKIKNALADLGKAYGALLRIEEDDDAGKIISKESR